MKSMKAIWAIRYDLIVGNKIPWLMYSQGPTATHWYRTTVSPLACAKVTLANYLFN